MPKGICLAIGLNRVDPLHYDGAGPLTGCESDAQAVAELARAAGLAVSDTLLSEAATREKVIGSIRAVGADLAPGDLFLLHYAGHGAQIPDENGDEADTLDETWCLYDAMLIDDEFAPLWAAFPPGVRIVVLSDSCHSGTISRAGKIRETRLAHVKARAMPGRGVEPDGPIAIRALPDDAAAETYHAHRAAYRAIKEAAASAEIGAGVMLLSGCRDDQTAKDIGSHGAFTKALLEVWAGGEFRGDWRDLRREIRRRIVHRYDQDPQLSTRGEIARAMPKERPFAVGV